MFKYNGEIVLWKTWLQRPKEEWKLNDLVKFKRIQFQSSILTCKYHSFNIHVIERNVGRVLNHFLIFYTLHSGHYQVMLSCSQLWTSLGRTSWGELRTAGMPSKPPPPQAPWKHWPPVDRTWRKYRKAWRFVYRSLRLCYSTVKIVIYVWGKFTLVMR